MAKKSDQYSGEEKRGAARRPILDTFSIFVVVPAKGDIKLPIHDLSELGIGFDIDTGGGEAPEDFPVKEHETLDIHIYLNQSLFIPCHVDVVRVDVKDAVRSIGARFRGESKEINAIQTFVSFLDQVVEAGQIKRRKK